MTWVHVAMVAFAVPLFALIPGAVLTAHLSFLNAEERTAAAGGFGLAVLGASAFLAHLIGLGAGVVNATVWMSVVTGGVASLALSRRPLGRAFSWPLLGLWTLFYAALIGLQGMTPVYTGGNWWGDWWEHHSISQAWLRGEAAYSFRWFGHDTLASRTPLFNLGAAFTLSILGEPFWIYQVQATFTNSLFLLALYLLAKELSGQRTALLAVLFVFFNTWLTHNAMFTWTKMTLAYFVLLSLYFYLRFRGSHTPAPLYMSALLGGLALMTHQGAAPYLLALAIDYLWLLPRTERSWRQASVAGTIVAALVVPWHLWIHSIYGLGHMVKVVPAMSMGAWSWAPQARGILENTVTSIVPIPLLDFILHGNFVWRRILFRLVEFYFNPLAGALTVSLIAAVLSTTAARPRRSFVLGFHRLGGPQLCLGFGGSMLILLWLVRPAFDFRRFGAAPFVWLLAAGLVATGLATLFRRPGRSSSDPAAGPMATSPHLTATLFVLVGYWGGLLIHPGGEREGIAANALVPSVIVVIVYAMGRVAKLRTGPLAAFFLGLVVEFAVTWAFLGSLIAEAPAFRSDGNYALKLAHHVVLLHDRTAGEWRPFAALTLAAQGACAFAVARWVSRHPPSAPPGPAPAAG